MELILKNNHIYLPVSNNVVISDASYSVKMLDNIDIGNYNKVAIINGSQKAFDTEFSITKLQLSKPSISLEINLVHKETGEVLKYNADELPVTRAFILGRVPTECYPNLITSLINRVNAVEDMVKQISCVTSNMSKSIDTLNKDVMDCNKAIVEISMEGEIV